MTAITRLPGGVLWGWPLLLLTLGCAGLDVQGTSTESLSEKRRQRAEQTLRHVEAAGDFAGYQAALDRWNQGDVRRCEADLQRLLKRNPQHADAWLLLAELYLTQNRLNEAEASLGQALAVDPDNPRVQYATVQLREALAASAAAGPATLDAQPVELPIAEQAAGRAAASDDSGCPPSPSSDARTAVRDGQADRAGATDVGGRSDASGAERLIEQGTAALAAGSPPAALAYFNAAARADPNNPQILARAAVEALRHNQPDLAVELLEPLQHGSRMSAQTDRILGMAYYRLGDFASSQAALRHALSLDKSSALTYFLLGCTLAKLGQFEPSEAHFRQARRIDPKYELR